MRGKKKGNLRECIWRWITGFQDRSACEIATIKNMGFFFYPRKFLLGGLFHNIGTRGFKGK